MNLGKRERFMDYFTYAEIKKLRDEEMNKAARDHVQLNHLHDRIMHKVINTAIFQIEEKYGPCPTPFSFIVMGSAGRFEQAIWSDQDHGIIYRDCTQIAQQYFLKLGKEISEGLFQTGYAYCDGDVMASNPLWCQSLSEWQQQLTNWMQESSWESIRHLLIFIDGRSLYGENSFINELKMMVYHTIQTNLMLPRIIENTLHFKKGLGVLGQFLVETHGLHTGSLNLKEKVLFPYVNAIRLFAIKENIFETSTLSRLDCLPDSTLSTSEKAIIEQNFMMILNLRLSSGNHTDYESGHFLATEKLTSTEKKVLKDIIKFGAHFFQSSRKLVKHDGHE
jgi:CBS domain-containing protein